MGQRGHRCPSVENTEAIGSPIGGSGHRQSPTIGWPKNSWKVTKITVRVGEVPSDNSRQGWSKNVGRQVGNISGDGRRYLEGDWPKNIWKGIEMLLGKCESSHVGKCCWQRSQLWLWSGLVSNGRSWWGESIRVVGLTGGGLIAPKKCPEWWGWLWTSNSLPPPQAIQYVCLCQQPPRANTYIYI